MLPEPKPSSLASTTAATSRSTLTADTSPAQSGEPARVVLDATEWDDIEGVLNACGLWAKAAQSFEYPESPHAPARLRELRQLIRKNPAAATPEIIAEGRALADAYAKETHAWAVRREELDRKRVEWRAKNPPPPISCDWGTFRGNEIFQALAVKMSATGLSDPLVKPSADQGAKAPGGGIKQNVEAFIRHSYAQTGRGVSQQAVLEAVVGNNGQKVTSLKQLCDEERIRDSGSGSRHSYEPVTEEE
jgi:hypothetical protein